MTVTSLRSAAGGGAGPEGAAAGGARGLPQSPQNFSPGATCAPQCGQVEARCVPHSPQNLKEVGFSLPQDEQRMPLRSLLADPAGRSSRRVRQPRPMNGILVAITVMNWTFASRGRLAM